MSSLSLPGGLNPAQQIQLLAASAAAPSTDWTATRAGKLDVLGAGGAGELTPARAALLTNADVAVTTLLSAIVNNVQYGVIDLNNLTSQTATITAVVVAKSFVVLLGVDSTYAGARTDIMSAKVMLTNTTTVTATRQTGDATTFNVRFCVVEFK